MSEQSDAPDSAGPDVSVEPGWYVDPADPTTHAGGTVRAGSARRSPSTPPHRRAAAESEPPEAPAPAPRPTAAGRPGTPASRATVSPVPGHRPRKPRSTRSRASRRAGPTGSRAAAGPGSPTTGAGQPAGPRPGSGRPAVRRPVGRPAGRTSAGAPPHGLPLAGYGARLVARLVDFAVVFALNAVVNGWFVWRSGRGGRRRTAGGVPRAPGGRHLRRRPAAARQQAGGLLIVILLIATALWFAYEVPTMASGGQTIGKRLLRIRAVPLAPTSRWASAGPAPVEHPGPAHAALVLLRPRPAAPARRLRSPRSSTTRCARRCTTSGAQTVVVQVPRRDHAGSPPTDATEPPGDTP